MTSGISTTIPDKLQSGDPTQHVSHALTYIRFAFERRTFLTAALSQAVIGTSC